MSETRDDPPPGARSGPRTDRDEQVGQAAERLGRALGRFARQARSAGEELAREARPEAERLARQARTAAEAARPHLERAGREAVRYAREHEDDIKRAARVGASYTARRVVPLPLRPIVDAVEADRRRRPPLRDDRDPFDSPPS